MADEPLQQPAGPPLAPQGPESAEEQWANAQPGDDLGVLEDDGQLRLRPNAGPTKAFELQRPRAPTCARSRGNLRRKKQKTDDEDDDRSRDALGRPQGTLVLRPQPARRTDGCAAPGWCNL